MFGQILPQVQLRFNSAQRGALHASALAGMKRFGPYDQSLFPQRHLLCGLIYPANAQSMRDSFVNGFQNGDGAAFPGFATLFRVQLVFDTTTEERLPGIGSEHELRRAATRLTGRNCDLVFVIGIPPDNGMYRACKETLLLNGIPCQVLATNRFHLANQRPWILSNLALASYAKVGGTPWVVADTHDRRELVMGISRAQDADERFVVGFVTLFNQDGDFLFLNSQTPVARWEDYVSSLESMVVDAYRDYTQAFGIPESLIVHFHKRPGEREIIAINHALQQLSVELPYAMVHLNEFSLFRMFDTRQNSYIPPSGVQVNLSRRRALLLLDGLENGHRNRRGVPNVWDISLDKRSTMSFEEFPRLVQQVHRFARVNWRGFNARSTPVTMNYSKLICNLVLEIGLDSWNGIAANGRLREKAWFL